MTTTLTREEAQQVLDALERLNRSGDTQVFDMYDAPVLIPLLRARLAQPEPEAVAWWNKNESGLSFKQLRGDWQPLYTAPPQREWQGLTDEEAAEVERWVEFKEDGSGRIPIGKLIRYIEAKLKEKNSGR
jgi:hypothetical protein